MAKLITFFLLCFLGSALLGSVMQGGGGVVVTELVTSIDADDTTITVETTENFLSIDFIQIGDERILYSSKDATHFYVAPNGRGYKDTSAAAHTAGRFVYAGEPGVLNAMAGYNIGSITDATGIWAAINIPFAVLKLIGNALWINFSYLGTDLALLTYFYFAMGLGLILCVVIYLAGGRRVV